MSRKNDLIGPFITLVSVAVVGIAFVMIYLLIGDNIRNDMRKKQALANMQQSRSNQRAKSATEDDSEKVVDGIHLATGLIFAEGFQTVRGNCTYCHSAKLITQNRATREGWKEMIRWMQAKQNLPDLGSNEPIILDYLATNYAPEEIGRRANIDVEAIKWYVLDLESKK